MDLEAEMEFLTEIFESDRKNYHAWSYRIWLIERFQLWVDELQFVDDMLKIDKGNNSVWSYRYFILNKAPTGLFKEHTPGSIGFVSEEIDVAGNWLLKDISNESAYVYFRGLLCVTPEEELKSQSKSVKRICINKV